MRGSSSDWLRTTNLLYVAKGLVPQPEFEQARELRIDEMWHWSGQICGGLSDGTSIADHFQSRSTD